MTIIETMAKVFYGSRWVGEREARDRDTIEEALQLQTTRAALRAVKPSDISDEMVIAAGKEYWAGMWDDATISDEEWLLTSPGLSLRRAIAAAIAKGAEQ